MKKTKKNNYGSNRYEHMGALEPYFELVQNEYNRERDRKQSLETRGGIAVTVLGALCAYIIKEYKIISLICLMHIPLDFITLIIIIILGTSMYILSLLCLWFSFKVLKTANYSYFDVSQITAERLSESKSSEMYDIILLYKDTINMNRKANEYKANNLDYLMKILLICILCTFTYGQLGVENVI